MTASDLLPMCHPGALLYLMVKENREEPRGRRERLSGRRVQDVLNQAHKQRATVWLTVVNYGEVIYSTEREQGLKAAHKLIAVIDQLPIEIVDVDRRLALAAAHIKAQHPLSYADAYAVALAQDRQATIVTADPEVPRGRGARRHRVAAHGLGAPHQWPLYCLFQVLLVRREVDSRGIEIAVTQQRGHFLQTHLSIDQVLPEAMT